MISGRISKLRKLVESATSHVLPNNSTPRHNSTFGIHKSKIRRQTGRANAEKVSVHPEPSAGAQSGDRRPDAGTADVQGRGELQSDMLRRRRHRWLGAGNDG